MKLFLVAILYQAASRPVGSQEANDFRQEIELKPVTPPAPLNPSSPPAKKPYDGTKSPTGTGTEAAVPPVGEVENNKLYDRLFTCLGSRPQSRTQYLEISYKELKEKSDHAFSAFVSYAYIVQYHTLVSVEGEKVTRAGKIVTLVIVALIASVFKLLPFLQMLWEAFKPGYLNKAL
ncbi:hypothetical protein SPFM20_00070 [Salmonella phage SPFM20]|nr:hypothetical protein SPFM20_00070 [Salmonella phage SPFM20]